MFRFIRKNQKDRKTELGWVSQDWEDAKRLSVAQKRAHDLYTNLMYSYGFRTNNRDYIYSYIPYYVENGQVYYDENAIAREGTFWEVVQPESSGEMPSSALLDRFQATNPSTEDIIVSVDVPSNIKEDYTINEIIDQKQLSFVGNNLKVDISEKLQRDIKAVQDKLEQQRKAEEAQANGKQPKKSKQTQQLEENAQRLASILTDMDRKIDNAYKEVADKSAEFMRDAKWYPYAGMLIVPFIVKGKVKNTGEQVERMNFRHIEVNPFNLDYDATKNKLKEVDYLSAAERITLATFIKRARSGEFSEIKPNTSMDKLIDIWDTETFYEFLPYNFPDAGLSRSTSIRWDTYFSGSNDDSKASKDRSENAYGVIDYYFIRNIDNTLTMYTLLNGMVIGVLELNDLGIDEIPLVLFSESPNINRDLKYQANLAFRLISSQLEIQISNKKIAEAQNDMQPVLAYLFVNESRETLETKHEEQTNIYRGSGQNIYTFYTKDPKTASQSMRIETGANVYTPFIRELEELKTATKNQMREAAGITDFMQGSDAHSMESQAGLSEMIAAGLKSEIDIVRSHSNSLTELLLIQLYFTEVAETMSENAVNELKAKRAKVPFKPKSLPKLSLLLSNYRDTFKFSIESEYSKTQTNSIITSVLLPLSAQIKQPEVMFDLVKMLPITQDLKIYLDGIEDKLKAAREAEVEQQQQMEQNKASLEREKMLDDAAIKKTLQDNEHLNELDKVNLQEGHQLNKEALKAVVAKAAKEDPAMVKKVAKAATKNPKSAARTAKKLKK